MRIISGTQKGLQVKAPAGLPIRPTTDTAKESLFNILNNYFHFHSLQVLDLFAGSGNISFECCSRGAQAVTAVEQHNKCCAFIKEMRDKYQWKQLDIVRAEVFSYLAKASGSYHFIFADPPYAMNGLQNLPDLIFEKKLLKEDGWLVIEHARTFDFKKHPNFAEERLYGQSAFSFFRNPEI